jgi:outer membrane beta-barrel protein
MRNLRHRSRALLIVALALVGSTALAAPKKKKPAPKPAPANTGGGGSGDSGEIEMDSSPSSGSGSASAGTGSDSGEIEMDENPKQGDLSADLAASDQNNATVQTGPLKRTPISWKDIIVVIRKPFLKLHRVELNPYVGVTMNDNMITHETGGAELAYWLTDVLAVGVEGMYYIHQFGEPYDLVARQARRLPTVNQYNWSGALDFHYVPVYGKFALLDRKLLQWEIGFTAGIGVGQSQVVPRDKTFPGFNNLLIEPNIGVNMRFFITKWLTLQLGLRDYIFLDHFEPTNRSPMKDPTSDEAKADADSSLINNIMFQIGLSFWLPTSFEYTTFR